MNSKNFKRYPDTNGTSLRKVIANKFKIDKNRIILGSGSDQIFELVCNAFIKKNDEVIVPKYSFIIYRIYSKINGAKIIYAKEKKFKVSISEIIKKVTKKLSILENQEIDFKKIFSPHLTFFSLHLWKMSKRII